MKGKGSVEMESDYVAQFDLELEATLLPQPLE